MVDCDRKYLHAIGYGIHTEEIEREKRKGVKRIKTITSPFYVKRVRERTEMNHNRTVVLVNVCVIVSKPKELYHTLHLLCSAV